jgi:hypothetical protein
MGMDSLLAIELKNRLQTAMEVALPATLALNHPSLESLTAALSPLVLVDLVAGATVTPAGTAGAASTGAGAAAATAKIPPLTAAMGLAVGEPAPERASLTPELAAVPGGPTPGVSPGHAAAATTGAAADSAADRAATDLDALPDDLIAEMLAAELREAGY